MESQKFDIVELIELNPITRLSKNYQGKFIEKIQQNFTESQQKLFIASFYTYLNYNSKIDFVIELEAIWKWLGFGRKDFCKRVLTKNFTKEIDYKIFTRQNEDKNLSQVVEAGFSKNLGGAGLNKEKILMTVHTFKALCLRSNTKKAFEIHDYFIKLEELTHDTMSEESIDLRLELQTQKTNFIKEKQQILLDSYNKKCIVYLIKIRENLYKFGNTDNIKRRLKEHKREIHNDIQLIYCLESKNNVKVEKDLKEYLKLTKLRKEEIFNNKIQTELIQTDDIEMIQNELEKMNKPIDEYIQILKKEMLVLKNENEKLKNQRKNDEETSESEDSIEDKESDKESDRESDEENTQKEDEALNNENDEINALPEINQIDLEIKMEKLKKRNEYLRKYNQQYRQTQKYKEKMMSEEAKLKERTRYHKRKVTEQYKETRVVYRKNNKERIQERETNNKRKKSKTTLVKTDAEKLKFHNWLGLNVIQQNNSNLVWWTLLDKYLNYHTSTVISKIYKEHFIEYITLKFVDITTKYVQFKIDDKHVKGYRNFSLVI